MGDADDPPALVIGVGNRDRGDDAVGPVVAERLAARGIDAVEHSHDGAALLDAWAGRGTVVLVDAMRSGVEPGTIRRFDASRERLPKGAFGVSSHLFGPLEAVETARALGRLPPILIVFGIEGGSYRFGEPLSPAVERAARTLVDRIVDELKPTRSRGR